MGRAGEGRENLNCVKLFSLGGLFCGLFAVRVNKIGLCRKPTRPWVSLFTVDVRRSRSPSGTGSTLWFASRYPRAASPMSPP